MNEIEADVDGTIVAILVENGAAGRVRPAALQDRAVAPAAMFKKVLIANRGEIALRVIRACRELGIAVGRGALDRRRRRAARQVRRRERCASARRRRAQSYLNVPAIISAAEVTGADAVHPGYGFLVGERRVRRGVRASCELTLDRPAAGADAPHGRQDPRARGDGRGRRADPARHGRARRRDQRARRPPSASASR